MSRKIKSHDEFALSKVASIAHISNKTSRPVSERIGRSAAVKILN